MKPFELNRSGLCNTCNKKIAEEKLKCSHCDTYYHATCSPTDPICTNKAFLKTFITISTNKLNFSWMCDHCLTASENDKIATISEQISVLRDAVVKLTEDKTKIVDEVKSQMSQDVQELKTQMNNEFTLLTEACTSSINSQLVDVRSHFQQELGTRNAQSNNPWSDQLRTEKVKSALLVKPNGAGNKVDTQKVRKIVTENRIPVNSVVETQNGELFVNLPDEESRDRVSDLIEESGNDVVKLQSKLPTVSLMGMTVKEMKNEEGEYFSKTELEESIYNLNKPIADLVDNGAVLKVVYIKPPKQDHQKFYTVVARVSPEIRKVLHKNRNKVHIGARVHNINDRFYIKRCNHCQELGHYADKCQCDHPVCGFCAQHHDSDACPLKNKPHKDHKCINCSESNLEAKGHPAFWTKCPAYKAAQDKLKKSISFDYNTLN